MLDAPSNTPHQTETNAVSLFGDPSFTCSRQSALSLQKNSLNYKISTNPLNRNPNSKVLDFTFFPLNRIDFPLPKTLIRSSLWKMDIEQKQSELIDHFVKRASAASDAAALASVLVEATSHPSLFAFSEILALPNLLQVPLLSLSRRFIHFPPNFVLFF